jgi:hypothetical protein
MIARPYLPGVSLWIALVFTGIVVPAHAEDAGTPLRVGAASVDITPPAGTPMAGYYHARAAEGVHDNLFARALVLQVGETKVAIVALDLISTTSDLVEDARKAVEQTTGVPGPHVLISASHAHTGPVLAGRSRRENDLGGANELARSYRDGLPARVAEAVQKANARLAPARARAAHGLESSIAFNRRFHMIDGSVGWNPGKKNPKIVKPAGPIDPDVPFVVFDPAGSKDADAASPLAVYVNYAVHLDNIGGLKISADVPGVVARALADVHGPELVTLYGTGCCGDINHVDVNSPEPQKGFGNAARMGLILAAEVMRAWPELKTVGAAGPLQVRSAKVELALPAVSEEDVAEAKAVLARRDDAKQKQPTFLEIVQAYKVLDVADRKGEPRVAEVQVITLGQDLAWVSLPGEIFVELGLELKQDSPFPFTLPVELANGSVGYVPTRRAYPQGNYEVVSARVAEGSGEKLVAAAVTLLKQMHREALAATPAPDTP